MQDWAEGEGEPQYSPQKSLRQPNGEFWSWVASWSYPELGQGGHAAESVFTDH